jgi:LmbE family N-acetylglucosaminyl deacetylase
VHDQRTARAYRIEVMNNRLFVLWLVFLPAVSAGGRTRAVQHTTGLPTPSSVMWIGAHPDDEAVIAPLLALWCRDLRARCAMVVLTRGEAGVCLRSDGCLPDIATVRSSEAGAASQYFHSSLTLLTLPDGGGVSPPSWTVAERPDLAESIAGYILAFHPDLVVTFDPRHGTTCHPDHRATGNLVRQALSSLANPPQLYFLETRVAFLAAPSAIRFYSATTSAVRFDANTILSSTGQAAWQAVADDMQRHTSQFDQSLITAVQNVPVSDRAVFLARGDVILGQSVETCP